MNPYQRIIRDGKIIQSGSIDTHTKFKQLTEGINLKGKSVLDVGCNLGEMCRLAKEAGASKVHGIDIRRDYIEDARKLNPGLSFECRPAHLATGNWDVVIASAIFHYIPDMIGFMKHMGRITNEVLIMDVWYSPISYGLHLSNRGSFIPTLTAFDWMARKYFVLVSDMGQDTISPDGSQRRLFHLTKPIKDPLKAVLIYGGGGTGKTTLARSYFTYQQLQLDAILSDYNRIKKTAYTSVMDLADKKHNSDDYIAIHKHHLAWWLNARINLDVVIDGYDMVYNNYRDMVKVLLLERGWKDIEEIKL